MKDFFQILFAGAVGALAAYFNVLLIPLAVLMGAMLIDYITGMAGAACTGEINSRVGVTGIGLSRARRRRNGRRLSHQFRARKHRDQLPDILLFRNDNHYLAYN